MKDGDEENILFKKHPMADSWIDLCELTELPEQGIGKYIVQNDHALAAYKLDDQTVIVMDDNCPHAGASLSAGHVDDGCVVCPWHHWQFHMQTGKNPNHPEIAVRTYETRIVAGRVETKLP